MGQDKKMEAQVGPDVGLDIGDGRTRRSGPTPTTWSALVDLPGPDEDEAPDPGTRTPFRSSRCMDDDVPVDAAQSRIKDVPRPVWADTGSGRQSCKTREHSAKTQGQYIRLRCVFVCRVGR